ncbi:hypothetical protein FPRO03_03085 [Fusarium proliferatum]|nr:hypothetical protein FPRO03_03085 [Fusarium proliferatum]
MSLPTLDKATLGHVVELAKNRNILAGAAAVFLIGMIPRFNAWLTRRKVNNHLTDSSWDWTKEVVVVTGGSSGIGKEIVLKLAKKHTKVIIVDLNAPGYQLPPNVSFCSADLSDPIEISKVSKQIVSEHGDPTVLINNAGIGNAMSILACPESKIHKVFDVNMIAPILLVKHFLPAMIRRNHGHIVNVGSMASFATQASNVDYGCTKSGLLAFHEGLLQELRHIYKAPLVRASIIHPTWVKTPLIADLIAKGKMKDTTISAESVADGVVKQLYTGEVADGHMPSWLIEGPPEETETGDETSTLLANDDADTGNIDKALRPPQHEHEAVSPTDSNEHATIGNANDSSQTFNEVHSTVDVGGAPLARDEDVSAVKSEPDIKDESEYEDEPQPSPNSSREPILRLR